MTFVKSVADCHPVLQSSLIEGVWREDCQLWVHAILNLQSHGSDPHWHQSLEHWLVKSCLGCPKKLFVIVYIYYYRNSRQTMTGPSCRWSPTRMTCLAPLSIGSRHSGSMAWVASSISTWWNLKFFSLWSEAVMQVAQITSAELKMSLKISLII